MVYIDFQGLTDITPQRFWGRVLHPGEPALAPDAAATAITVHYPRRATPVLGLDVPWWLTFLVVSMATARMPNSLLSHQ